MFSYRIVNKKDHNSIIQLLQAISDFYPSTNKLDIIWNEFIDQDDLTAYSFFAKNQLVGFGTFIIEKKIRGGHTAHIEDIVVDSAYRGKGFGKKVIQTLIKEANNKGCYKASLACKKHNIEFYKSCGFVENGINMSILL